MDPPHHDGKWALSNSKIAIPVVAFVALGAWSIDRTICVANLREEIAQGEADRA